LQSFQLLVALGSYAKLGHFGRPYTILQPDDWQTWAGKLHGKVVLVNGSGFLAQVEEQNALNDAFRLRCEVLGEYPAALHQN
jgi:hypothetical protein